jgi:hydroxyethylthiazole kinase-like uncharacterized protein yjeF
MPPERHRLRPVLRASEIRALEARHAGAGLMERAGAAAAQRARDLAGERGARVVVLAGPGNNGGDGFVVARLLREAFHEVAVVFRDETRALPPDAAEAHARFMAAGGTTVEAPPEGPVGLVVDALFGIGLHRALEPRHAELVDWANHRSAPVLAIDVPTGLDADTGIARAPAVRATATATFLALKPGLLTAEGPDFAGSLGVHPLDVDPEADAPAAGHALDWPALAAALPETLARRVRNSHKGTFGTLAIIGGADAMLGAALIAGRAALRCGAGKVRIGALAHGRPAVDFAMPELMIGDPDRVLAAPADAIVVGCGIGDGDGAKEAVARAIAASVPLVLDADALNLVAADAALRSALRRRETATIATPHPAEAARLVATTVAGIQHDRLAAAWSLSRELRAHAVLKGAGSVLAHPDGTWDINASGNPALAVAGSGDALAGIVGALLAQGIGAKDALRIGVCLHGAAADALVARGIGPVGVTTGEVVDAARQLLNEARTS